MKRKHLLLNHVRLLLVLALLSACSAPEPAELRDFQQDAPANVQQTVDPLSVLEKALADKNYTLNRSNQYVEGDVTVVPLNEIAGQVLYHTESGIIKDARLTLLDGGDVESGKWPVCHVPKGNPSNAHTIFVGFSATKAHVGNHGDEIGYCANDAFKFEGAGQTKVLLYEVEGAVYAYYTKLSYTSAGTVEAIEQGDSIGTASFEELTTVAPKIVFPEVEESTWYDRLVSQVREDLGEDASRVFGLEESQNIRNIDIPMMETNVVVIDAGGGGGCSNGCSSDPDPEPDPGEDDPSPGNSSDPDSATDTGGTDGAEDAGSDTGEDGGSSSDSGDDSGSESSGSNDDDGGSEDNDPGPSYSEEELAALEGDVTRAEERLENQERLIERTEDTVEEFTKKYEDAVDEARRIYEEEGVAELQEEIQELDKDIKAAKGEYNRDTLFVQSITLVLAPICTASKLGCAADAFGHQETTRGRILTALEVADLNAERAALEAKGQQGLENIVEQSSKARSAKETADRQQENLDRYKRELPIFEGGLEIAEGNLDNFKRRNNIP